MAGGTEGRHIEQAFGVHGEAKCNRIGFVAEGMLSRQIVKPWTVCFWLKAGIRIFFWLLHSECLISRYA